MVDNAKSNSSIEDLIASSSKGASAGDVSSQSKLIEREAEIKKGEIERITEKKSDQLGIPYVNLMGFSISSDALSLISEEDARKFSTICSYYDGANLRLASTRPKDDDVLELLKQVTEKTHCQGRIYLISDYSLKFALKLYKAIPKIIKIERGVKVSEEDLNKYGEEFSSFNDLQNQISKAQLTEMVAMILAASIKTRASDVHIEREEKEIKIRFRVDGVLHDAATLSEKMWSFLISRLKMLAGVKINISNKPQDGRVTIVLKDGKIDIRASFLPTAYGESVVMRLLNYSAISLTFDGLGIRNRSFQQLKHEIERPNGMIITTGPTGSGKTTTLYAILSELNDSETKIITVEDPIEYKLEGINQSQISEKYSFAQGLRSIVRQDPDVIMVGEIRDLETAEVAIQAALTGHVVLSTIHTNDAAGTIPRLLSMGTKPFLIAPAMNAMIGQRLVRRICTKCKKEESLDEETKSKIQKYLSELPDKEKEEIKFNPEKMDFKFYKSPGCPDCQNIGYKGRIGIYEILIMNEDIQKIILSGKVSEYDMRDIAKKKGMVTMVQDGLLKAMDGITSIEEVFRVAE